MNTDLNQFLKTDFRFELKLVVHARLEQTDESLHEFCRILFIKVGSFT